MNESSNKGHQTPPSFLTDETEEQTLSLADVLYIGTRLEFLRQTGKRRESEKVTKEDVKNTLTELQNLLKHRNFSSNLTPQISRLKEQIAQEDESETLTAEGAKEIVQKATTWTHLLSQELEREQRIPVADTGLLEVNGLLHRPEELFTPTVWDWLDERPRDDIREACKTILTGCPTSSVMLSLRAVEHCLREWYEEEEQERLDATWGRVLDQLMEKYTEEDKRNDTVLTQLSDLPPVLSTLYYLKEKRNEVSHPDDSPRPEEARRTLMIVASTITEIYSVMEDMAVEEAMAEMRKSGGSANVPTSSLNHSLSDLEKIYLENIRELNGDRDGDGVPREMLYEIGEQEGQPKKQVDAIIEELLMSGHLYESSPDVLKPI